MDLQNQRIIFYDGNCILCSQLIKCVIHWDKKEQFWYAGLQSNHANDILNVQSKWKELPDSIVYLRNGTSYFYSDAAIKIIGDLGGVFKFIFILSIIPKFLRDIIYKWIAKNRLKIFGESNTCFIPDEKIKARILD